MPKIHQDGLITIYQGDARNMAELVDGSVQCCVLQEALNSSFITRFLIQMQRPEFPVKNLCLCGELLRHRLEFSLASMCLIRTIFQAQIIQFHAQLNLALFSLKKGKDVLKQLQGFLVAKAEAVIRQATAFGGLLDHLSGGHKAIDVVKWFSVSHGNFEAQTISGRLSPSAYFPLDAYVRFAINQPRNVSQFIVFHAPIISQYGGPMQPTLKGGDENGGEDSPGQSDNDLSGRR